MKLASLYTDLCFKRVFENATAVRKARRRPVVNSSNCELQHLLNVSVAAGSRSRGATCDARFTRGR